jgi:predicted metal-dependent HD superfamily phosphohydrolase
MPRVPENPVAITRGTELGRTMQAYGAPWRCYHGLDHPIAVIKTAKMLHDAAHPHRPSRNGIPEHILEFAWYHDAVCFPGEEKNEQLSADLYASHLNLPRDDSGAWKFPTLKTRMVYNSIIATANPWQQDFSEEYVYPECLDADLAVLGGTPEQYALYCEDIFTEVSCYLAFQKVPLTQARELFYRGRHRFLKNLLEHMESGNDLYLTSFARQLWKQAALRNVSKEYSRITS